MAKRKRKKTPIRDKHLLYSAAVQSVDADCDFFQRVYRKKNRKPLRLLREDFCGTAALACEWVSRHEKNRAWGIDLDRETLEWGRKRYVPTLGEAAGRLELIRSDVMEVTRPKVDAVAAQNFSFCVFKTRPLLRKYFQQVRKSLKPGGILFTDILGGTEGMDTMKEKRRIPSSKAFDGTKIPAFTYIWEQARFNPVNHDFECKIHFKLPDGTKIKKAFHYDWRLWTLPELQELMLEAGFASTEVYVEGWDEEADDTDGIFRRRKSFENQTAWVAYVVGLT
jgi:SAM-dependent methyltransferase